MYIIDLIYIKNSRLVLRTARGQQLCSPKNTRTQGTFDKMTPKLEIRNLYKVYGARPETALDLIEDGCSSADVLNRTGQVAAVIDVSFQVREGEIFTIMGLSGSGKSTLVRCLNRLIEPTRGSVSIDGTNVLELSQGELRETRRRKISMVFQNFALLPHKTVTENVQFGLSLRGESAQTCRQRAKDALAQVGLSDWGERYPDDLSGGMKQRVGLARALASDPDILLMDEPFSALDPLIREELQQELLKLQREINKTIIFITHDFLEAVKLSDQLAVMRDGRFVQVGSPQEIVLSPVDDYVRNFAKSMDRSQILTAGMLAQKIGFARIGRDSTVDDAARALSGTGHRFCAMTDEDGHMQGLLSAATLAKAPAGAKAAGFLSPSLPVLIGADALLTDLYRIFVADQPVGITSAEGALLGLVEAHHLLQVLADRAPLPGDAKSAEPGPRPGAQPCPQTANARKEEVTIQ